jgi:hypothetical protein
VHHIWGIYEQVPGALLLIDPKKCLRKFEMGVALVNLEMSAKRLALLPPGIDRSLIAVWKEGDLTDARASMIDALDVLGILAGALSLSRPAIRIGDQERQQLLSRPAIAQALHKMSQQKTPPAPRKRRGKNPAS